MYVLRYFMPRNVINTWNNGYWIQIINININNKVLRTKYGCGQDIIPKIGQKGQASNLWRGVCSAWNGTMPQTSSDSSWINGSPWKILWKNMLVMDRECTVNQFLLPSGQWDVQKLRRYLPENVFRKILAVHVPSCSELPDRIILYYYECGAIWCLAWSQVSQI